MVNKVHLLVLLLHLTLIDKSKSTILWSSLTNGHTAEDPTISCLTGKATQSSEGGDHILVSTNNWHSGGIRTGCLKKDGSWNCIQSCFPYNGGAPSFENYASVSFYAKAVGDFATTCKPRFSMTGGGWPRSSSNQIDLDGSYVEKGGLVSDEYRRVVIPIEDLKTATWNLNAIYALYWHNCGSGYSSSPKYWIQNVEMLDSIPSLGTGAPTVSPTTSPSTKPTVSPSSSEPTSSPSSSEPTASPSTLRQIWSDVRDSYSLEDGTTTCVSDTRYVSNTTTPSHDYLTVTTDTWHSGGLIFGCIDKDSDYRCIKSCYPFNTLSPSFRDSIALHFEVMVSGPMSDTCFPRVQLTGGGWQPTGGYLASNAIRLSRDVIDYGEISSTEWRRVSIPVSLLKTAEWDLSDVHAIYFQRCPEVHGANLVYRIRNLEIRDYELELISASPTLSPTVQVTMEDGLATHEFFHRDYFPVRSEQHGDSTWIYAEDGAWPFVPQDTFVTVVVPPGEQVIYSLYDNTTVYDKIIVQGVLSILPEGNDVLLQVGTIIVEDTGFLDVMTRDTSHQVLIEIQGNIDAQRDPTEMWVGIVSMGGIVHINGDVATDKMAPLSQTASAGTTEIVVHGHITQWNVGDELLLPDTQRGLDVSHWNFPAIDHFSPPGQTEYVTVASITNFGPYTSIGLATPLTYTHDAGCHVAHLTRSIAIRTSSSSPRRGHIMHTGHGTLHLRNALIQNMGRSNIDLINDTLVEDSGLHFANDNYFKLEVVSPGDNQLGRYAVHAHFAMEECYFQGNVIRNSPRHGLVAHNSRVHIRDNVVVDAAGAAVFLEGGTETGTVRNNFVVGAGRGGRGNDDGRFSSQSGNDMGSGGFGIWSRGTFASIANNRAEGHFGFAPFSFFVHTNFISDHIVPNVTGTPADIAGKTLRQISHDYDHGIIPSRHTGAFVNNTALGTWRAGLDLSYFGAFESPVGFVIDHVDLTALAKSGKGLFSIHSDRFTLRGGAIRGVFPGNSIVGVFCNNGNLTVNYDGVLIEGVGTVEQLCT